jgi:hypothetical protein
MFKEGEIMKIKTLTILALTIILLIIAMPAKATVVDISVSTDKPVYQLGEYVTVYLTAYNPNPEPVTLNFAGNQTVTYIMDGTFDPTQGTVSSGDPWHHTIDAYGSWTIDMVHGAYAISVYPLNVGNHSVVGIMIGSYSGSPFEFESSPVHFAVVPEPTTLLLLTFGTIVLRHKRRNVNTVAKNIP